MAGSKPQPVQTTTQVSEPPAYVKPFLEGAAQEAQRLYQTQTPQYYPGSTVVPFSGETQQALDLTTQRALAGSPLMTSAQQGAQQIVEGRGVNPFLAPAVQAATQPLFEQFQQQTIPGLTSSFAAIGRSGSGAENNALQQAVTNFSRGVGEQATRAALAASEGEAARQFAAIQGAPQMAAADYADIGRLAAVGSAREGQSQLQLQDQIDRYNFAQNIQAQQLNQLLAQLAAAGGGGGTVTSMIPNAQARTGGFANAAGGALSGAASGAMLGSVIPGVGNVVGAGIGGTLGLLGGL